MKTCVECRWFDEQFLIHRKGSCHIDNVLAERKGYDMVCSRFEPACPRFKPIEKAAPELLPHKVCESMMAIPVYDGIVKDIINGKIQDIVSRATLVIKYNVVRVSEPEGKA